MPELAKVPPPLKVPQARVLAALCPEAGVDDPPLGTVPRAALAEAAGILPTTGTINRVLNGIPDGSSSGASHPGLVETGLIERVELDLDGRATDSYRITRAGIAAVRAWLATNELPPLRDAESCTNRRYATPDADDHLDTVAPPAN
jgi:hypothetical protein